jgi:hypothetical protein
MSAGFPRRARSQYIGARKAMHPRWPTGQAVQTSEMGKIGAGFTGHISLMKTYPNCPGSAWQSGPITPPSFGK